MDKLFLPSPPQYQTPSAFNPGAGVSLAPPPFQTLAGEGSPYLTEKTKGPTPEQCMATPDQVDPNSPWQIFADEFNQEFQDVLHVFHGDGAEGHLSGKNQGLTAAQASCLFTEKQRKLLLEFISTEGNPIPDRLFNDDNPGYLNAQQRLLISGHILANGTYQPGSFTTDVHARMCFHWVQITHHYAGATTHKNAAGVSGGTDLGGNIVFGEGKVDELHSEQRVYEKDLPKAEKGELGPIPKGTSHWESAQANPGKGFRCKEFPFSRFGEIQPGDWLYIYNANPSLGGNHSVLFSHWASKEETHPSGVQFRDAVVYDQGSPEQGGDQHTIRLGDDYVQKKEKGEKTISPITRIARVDADTQPADSINDILPELSEKKETQRVKQNEAFIKSFIKKHGEEGIRKLVDMLQRENDEHLWNIAHRLTSNQLQLLMEANKFSDYWHGDPELQAMMMTRLVRLTQRLRSMRYNSDLLDQNTESTYEGTPATEDRKAKQGLNEKYDAQTENYAEAEAKYKADQKVWQDQIDPIDLEIEQEEAKLDQFENKSDALKTARKNHRDKKEEAKSFGGIPRKGTEERAKFDTVKEEQAQYYQEIQELKKYQKEYDKNTEEIRDKISALKSKKKKLDKELQKIHDAWEEEMGTLPYGMVHPGSNKKQDRSLPTGRMKDLFSEKEWRNIM